MGTNECSQPASKSSWDSQDFGDVNMVLKMVHFHKSSRPQWVNRELNKIFPHTFWRPFLDCMPQLFFRPKYVWFPIHLKGPMIPDPSGQLAELIVYITSIRVVLYSHQILLPLRNGLTLIPAFE